MHACTFQTIFFHLFLFLCHMQITLKGSFAYIYFICSVLHCFTQLSACQRAMHVLGGGKKGIFDEGCANTNQLHYSIGYNNISCTCCSLVSTSTETRSDKKRKRKKTEVVYFILKMLNWKLKDATGHYCIFFPLLLLLLRCVFEQLAGCTRLQLYRVHFRCSCKTWL